MSRRQRVSFRDFLRSIVPPKADGRRRQAPPPPGDSHERPRAATEQGASSRAMVFMQLDDIVRVRPLHYCRGRENGRRPCTVQVSGEQGKEYCDRHRHQSQRERCSQGSGAQTHRSTDALVPEGGRDVVCPHCDIQFRTRRTENVRCLKPPYGCGRLFRDPGNLVFLPGASGRPDPPPKMFALKNRRGEASRKAGAEEVSAEEGEGVQHTCVVCMIDQKNCVFMPCRHCACCSDCGLRIHEQQGACPICRRKTTSILQFYT